MFRSILQGTDPKTMFPSDKTKHGVDKLTLMIFFISVFEGKSGKQVRKSFDKLKSFIVS